MENKKISAFSAHVQFLEDQKSDPVLTEKDYIKLRKDSMTPKNNRQVYEQPRRSIISL
jgi:hypothetical protein